MAKPELGTKRLCINCAAKFYDLNKDPIVCPKCDTVFVIPVVTSRSRPESAAAAAARAAAVPAAAVAAAAVAPEEAIAPETADAEFVSLEDADAEQQGKKKPVEGDAVEGAEDDIEIDPALDDAAFIEEQEEGDDDVTDIIGDVENEEEA